MHELSLTQSLVDLAIGYADRENAAAIRSVTVEIGALSGVMADAVEFAFDVCSKGTLAEGARLDIRHTPGIGRCQACGEQVEIEALSYVCPACDCLALEILQGREMRFLEMEID